MTRAGETPRRPKQPTPPPRTWPLVAGAAALAVVLLLLAVTYWGVRSWRARKAVAVGRDAPPLNLPFLDPTFAAPAAPGPVDGAIYVLENKCSGRCLSVEKNSPDRGARIVQGPTTAEAGPAERWRFVKVGDAFRLVNAASGKVLEVPGSSQDHGVRLIQWDDAGKAATNQLWLAEPVGESFRFRAAHSGQCACVGQGLQNAGAVVVQWDEGESADQFWALRPAGASPR